MYASSSFVFVCSLLLLLLVAPCCRGATVNLPQTFVSSWDVTASSVQDNSTSMELSFLLWSMPGFIHQKLQKTSFYFYYTDFLIRTEQDNNPNDRSCFQYNPYNGSCTGVACDTKNPCFAGALNCSSCQQVTPFWSEFLDANTQSSVGCGGDAQATLLNVTVLQSSWSALCYNERLQKPYFYQRMDLVHQTLMTGNVLDFEPVANIMDFEVPPFCSCYYNTTTTSSTTSPMLRHARKTSSSWTQDRPKTHLLETILSGRKLVAVF